MRLESKRIGKLIRERRKHRGGREMWGDTHIRDYVIREWMDVFWHLDGSRDSQAGRLD